MKLAAFQSGAPADKRASHPRHVHCTADGAGVAMSTGAAYDYPELIVVSMGQSNSVQAKVEAAKTASAAPVPAR